MPTFAQSHVSVCGKDSLANAPRQRGHTRGCPEQGLLEFLAYEPFYDNRNWSSLVLRKGEAGLERLMPLCSLLKGVMLRRTKDDVGGAHRHAALRC